MRYYLDTEFNGFGGDLLSLALVREDGASVYIVYPPPESLDPWVEKNVMPLLTAVPPHVEITRPLAERPVADVLRWFIGFDAKPVIIADWPDDIRYLCHELITGPGTMVKTASTIRFEVRRVDAYPTKMLGAVQHNAWWDAMALRLLLTKKGSVKRRIYGEQAMHAGSQWVPL